MAKNKGKFGKAKSQVEETDEFVSGMQRLGNKLKPHAMRIGLLIAGVAIALIAYGIYSWYSERKATAATAQFVSAAEHASGAIVEPDDDATPEPSEEDVRPRFKSAKERADATLSALDALGSEYGATGVSKESLLMRANTLLDLGSYDEAAALYDEYAKSGNIAELKLVAREGIGYALEEKALATEDPKARQSVLEEALAAFANVQPKEDGARHDHALFHQGRLLAVLDRKQEAKEMYEKVLALDDSVLKLEVENRLAELEANK